MLDENLFFSTRPASDGKGLMPKMSAKPNQEKLMVGFKVFKNCTQIVKLVLQRNRYPGLMIIPKAGQEAKWTTKFVVRTFSN